MAIETFEGLPIVDIGGRSLISALDAKKISFPNDGADFGNSGDQLRSLGNGGVEWAAPGMPTYEQTEQAISDWLNDHPEATTTVADGAITDAKLNDALKRGLVYGFETVTDTNTGMKYADNLVAGMICHTNGFHASGDGGAAWYEIVSDETANEMDVIACDGLFARLIADKVNPKMLGAYGNLTDDDTSIFNYMFSAYKNISIDGTFSINQVIIDNDDMNIEFTAESLIKSLYNGDSLETGLFMVGKNDTRTANVEILSQENNKVTVSNSSVFNVGDFVTIKIFNNNIGHDIAFQIVNIIGNDLYMNCNIPTELNIGSAFSEDEKSTISVKIPLKNVTMVGNGCKIDGNGQTGLSHFIHMFNCVNCEVNKFSFFNGSGKGVNVSSCTNCNVKNNIYEKPITKTTAKGESLLINYSTNVNVYNCVAIDARRGVDFVQSYYCYVYDCTNYECHFSTHGYASKFIYFINCNVYGNRSNTSESGFTIGNEALTGDGTEYDVYLIGCNIVNCQYGVSVVAESKRVYVLGCIFDNCRVAITGSNNRVPADVNVKDSYLINCRSGVTGAFENIIFDNCIYEKHVNENDSSAFFIQHKEKGSCVVKDCVIRIVGGIVFSITGESDNNATLTVDNCVFCNLKPANRMYIVPITQTISKVSILNCVSDDNVYIRLHNDMEIIGNKFQGYRNTDQVTENMVFANNVITWLGQTRESLIEDTSNAIYVRNNLDIA